MLIKDKPWYDTFKAANRDGVLPIKAQASQFRYRKAIIWKVDLTNRLINGGVYEGSWVVEFQDGKTQAVLFHQKVTLQMFLVSLNFAGLHLFTWNIFGEKYDTTNVGGQATTSGPDGNIGDFLLGGTWQSEQGYGDPASGQDSSGVDATISFDYISPIYRLGTHGAKVLKKGDLVVVTRDQWNFGPTTIEYGWAFLENDVGNPRVAASFGKAGELLTMRPNAADGVRLGRADPTANFGLPAHNVEIVGGPIGIYETRTGRVISVVQDEKGVHEWQTKGGFNTLTRRLYPVEGKLVERNVWGPNATMNNFVPVPSMDASVFIAVQSGRLVSRVVDRYGPAAPYDIGPAPADATPAITIDNHETLRIVATSATGVTPLYISARFPPQWERVGDEATSSATESATTGAAA